MEKILIISDSHNKNENVKLVLEQEGPFDRLIHLGDAEGSERYIEQIAGCPCEMISGNSDFFSALPKELEVQIGRYKTLLTHGNYYAVSLDTDFLIKETVARGFDMVMYGHTHRPEIEQSNGVIAMNPGSISAPRQADRTPTYIIMEVDDRGEITYKIHRLKKE